VVALSRTRSPELEALQQTHSDSLTCVNCDVTDTPAVADAINSVIESYGRIDGLVLNAGQLDPLGRIADPSTSVDAWKTHFDVNFFSLIPIVQLALPALRKGHGRIVFVSSGAAVGGTPSWGAYNAAKAAMNSLCRTLASEEPDVVSVALRPGMVDTSMQAQLRTPRAKEVMGEESANRFADTHVQGKLVRPEDCGHVIAELALRAPHSLSGQFVSWSDSVCKDFLRKD